jgi:hypothetical protein
MSCVERLGSREQVVVFLDIIPSDPRDVIASKGRLGMSDVVRKAHPKLGYTSFGFLESSSVGAHCLRVARGQYGREYRPVKAIYLRCDLGVRALVTMAVQLPQEIPFDPTVPTVITPTPVPRTPHHRCTSEHRAHHITAVHLSTE